MGFLSGVRDAASSGLFGAAGALGGQGAMFLRDSLLPDPRLQGGFSPYNVNSLFGSLSYDPSSRTMNLGLSPQMQAINNQMFGAMSGGPYGMTPEQMMLSQAGSTLGQQALGLGGMSGIFGRGLGLQAANAGSGFLGAANQMNPQDIAQGQFDRMQALLSPRRERAALGLESRLLRQGLLGSTAGGEQFRAMNEANAMQDAGIAESALREGMSTQQGLFGMGLQGMQIGQGLFGQGTGQQLGAMSSGLGFLGMPAQQQQQSLNNYLGLLSGQQGINQSLLGLANLGMGAGQAQSGIDAANAAARTAADNRLSDVMAGLIQGGMSAFGGT